MRRSFGLWLFALFAMSVIVPLAIFSIAIAAYFNRVFVEETKNMFANTLYSVSQHITTYTADLGRLSMTPYFQPEMMAALIDINSGRYFTDPVTAVRVSRYYHIAFSQQLATSRNDVVSVLFAPYSEEVDAGFLVRRHMASHQILRDMKARDTEWYKNAIAADGALYFSQGGTPDYLKETNPYHFHTDQSLSIFSVVRLIKDPTSMRPVGVIRVDAMNTVVSDIFRNILTTPSSMLVLLDANNEIIYSNADVAPELLSAAVSGAERVFDEYDSFYVSIAPIASTPWTLCYLTSERDIRQRTSVIYLVTALFGLVFLAAAFLIYYNRSRKTVQSMDELLLAMKKIAVGDLDIHLDIKQESYLGAIADNLNQTAERLDTHIKSEYKAVLNQRNAEYRALQSQINPHFLHNTLSGFVTLNRIGQRDALEQSIISLGGLFRYAAKQENLSTVQDEFGFLEQYLTLQQMRFADRLTFEIFCTSEAGQVIIPKLLLQPLVENAIVHGMEPYDSDLHIEVHAEMQNHLGCRCLFIVLSDDGAGFDARFIGPDSLGLANIMERLELFNENSFFQIRSKPGHGCKCVIVLPDNNGGNVC